MAGPDTNSTEAPYPIWGFGPPSPEPDTKKLDALLASLNGSAERFQTVDRVNSNILLKDVFVWKIGVTLILEHPNRGQNNVV
jgi:hypothetical protein